MDNSERFIKNDNNQEECSSGSYNNSNNSTLKADKLAIDKLLNEHRSDIIKLGFMRQSRRMKESSRLPTPLLAPHSNSSDPDPLAPHSNFSDQHLLAPHSNSTDEDQDCLENIDANLPVNKNRIVPNCDVGRIEKYCGVVSGQTLLEISSFLETRISEIKESKINEISAAEISKNANFSNTILESKSVSETKNEKIKNEIPHMSENNNEIRKHNPKSPFWSDNGELDDSSNYLRFPPLVPVHIEIKKNTFLYLIFIIFSVRHILIKRSFGLGFGQFFIIVDKFIFFNFYMNRH